MELAKGFVEECGGTFKFESWDQKNHPEDHGTLVTISMPSKKLN
jgi:hypothetical protein